MVKIMAIGDPHSKRGNQDELLECGKRVSQKIVEEKPNAIVVLGDLANDHEKVYVVALNGIVNFFDMLCTAASQISAKVYYIIGNHDAINNQIFLEDSHAFNAFKKWPNLVVVDKPIRLKSADGYITMCPYVPPGRLVEALDTIGRDKWLESMVVFCHQEFMDAKLGHIPSKHGDNWGTLLPLVVSGHIHGYHQLKNNIIYVGAPYDINFGDDGEKTISVLSFSDTELKEHKRIDLGMPRKITIKLTIDEAYSYVVPENANVRIYLYGTTQEFTKFKKTEHFMELAKTAKIIPQITDPVKVSKNIQRKGYLDILIEECEKENEFVKLALIDITKTEGGK